MKLSIVTLYCLPKLLTGSMVLPGKGRRGGEGGSAEDDPSGLDKERGRLAMGRG